MKFEGARLPTEFILLLPRLEDAFIRALRRGRPLGPLLSLWRRMFLGAAMPQT